MGGSGPAIRAAGGLLWRSRPNAADKGSTELAIIHRPRYDDWSLPKGKLTPGETEIDGAIREVLEETGFHVRLGRSLGETRYLKEQDRIVRKKVVRWWAMEATSGAFVPTREVDELHWVGFGEARDLLTRPTDRELLERFAVGPASSRMVLIVRHANAGSRSAWDGDDRARPLDECGWAQAEALVRLLAHFDPAEILSADFVRCAQTVEPLASAMALPIRPEPILSEAGYPGREDEAVALLRAIGAPRCATVLCSQGDVIPDLLGRLAAADGVELPAASNRKASTWSLAFDGPLLVGAEHFPPLEVAECGEATNGTASS
ncbi:MAG TPA: NUDIX hydrolase [Candidatus Dormibacteraeota bacterium]|nr:NUDIX hydrolase [Candidatus Dormibacteraeota bacterium]